MAARFGLGALLVAATLGVGATSLSGQVDRDHGDYPAADIAFGAQIFTVQCTQCHGATGDGVAGVNIRTGQFRSAVTDTALTNVITSGVPAKGMPSFNKLSAAEIAGLVAYIRNMNTFDAQSVPVGNVQRGRDVFEGKGACISCHRVDGRGTGLAPDLGIVGRERTASALQTSILDPTSAMLPINRPVRLVNKAGTTINGRRLNEDTYTVQIVDDQGRLGSFVKTDLKEFRILTQSPMPAYKGKLTSAEVADLVAYLLSLKGA
jgi:putative heme-binding domain-containing protein